MLDFYLTGIQLQIRISRVFSSMPYNFDKKTSRLVWETDPGYLRRYRLGRFVHGTYAAFMLTSFIHMWVTSESGGISVEQVLSIGWICCHVGSGMLRLGVAHKMDSLLQLFNSLIDFEKIMVKEIKEQAPPSKLMRLIIFMGCGASLGMPTFICLMIATKPCLPPMIGYSVLDCSSPDGPPPEYKYPLLIFNVLTWYNAFGMAYFLFFPVFYVPMVCIKEYLDTLMLVTFRNKVNHKIHTSATQRAAMACMYRRLQLINQKFNGCYQTVFIPIALVGCLLSGISSLFVAIRLHSVVPMAGMAFFAIKICILFVLFTFVFGFGGMIFERSTEMLDTWKNIDKLEKHGWFKRVLKSNYPLKIKFYNAFFEKLTPLVLNAFMIDQTVTLILLLA